MSSITTHVRLRPIRFAFIVRPDDEKRVFEIFQVNTCLWGGKYNPIVPYFEEVPSWWERNNYNFETAEQIINGYLGFFEPDFVVEAEPGLASRLGFQTDRVLQLSRILPLQNMSGTGQHGLSVYDLYSHLYRKEFQFTRRHQLDIIDVTPKESTYNGFSACLFGAFPTQSELKYLSEAFTDIFEPTNISLTGTSLANLYKSSFTSPLYLGHSEIEVQYHDDSYSSQFFVLDAFRPKDLVDFWNLQTIRRNIIPIPIQWISELSEFCKESIIENHRSYLGSPYGANFRSTVMFARSISTNDIKGIYTDYFDVNVPNACGSQEWYPPIWRPSPAGVFQEKPPTLSAGERDFDTPFDTEKPEVHFDCLHPEFANGYSNHNNWANVVRLRDWSFRDQIATVYPSDYKNSNFPRFDFRSDPLLSTTEGFVLFPQFKKVHEFWKMPDGNSAITNWLKMHKIDVKESDPGRATRQIIQTLGGLAGVTSFAHPDLVKLLDGISRSPILKSETHHQFKNNIKNAIKTDYGRLSNFETLVLRGAVQLGLELMCSNCKSWTWYSLNQLDYQLTCGLCLREFQFPILDPSNNKISRWAYRLIGPFTLPGFANGGYAASLSIRFFSKIISHHDASITWAAGLKLDPDTKNEIEADFILWYQRKEFVGNNHPTDIVFGEAKSYGRETKDAFEPKDVERMKTLAIRFPASVLVFSTMREAGDLTSAERNSIRELAEWGREYIKERRQIRAAVIILTGTELFASYSLSQTWKEKGGNHAQLSELWSTRMDNLRVVADLT